MGLDWNPIAKPQPGCEDEFEGLFRLLTGKPDPTVSAFQRIKHALVKPNIEQAKKRFEAIQITPFETIQAPRVGFDSVATQWARDRFEEHPPPGKTLEEFLKSMHGYYVVPLSPASDGLPIYTNGPAGYVECFSFRAQWLTIECEDILGKNTLERCYENCLAPGLAALGKDLREIATSYSSTHSVEHVADVRDFEVSEGSSELKAHILFSAARWCEWWSTRGHGLEAYF